MDARLKRQQDYYARLAPGFDRRWKRDNPNHRYKIEQIRRCFALYLPTPPGGADFLEVGAGTGIHALRFLEAHAGYVKHLTVSDLSGEMLEQARARLAGFAQVEYLQTPAESLATDRTFDGIYVSGAVHHFSDPQAGLSEMYRHLRPGGLLVVCEPIVWNPVNFVRAMSIREDWGQLDVTRPRVRRWLKAEGLELLEDRVLHWKGGGALREMLWPYQLLERFPALDNLAIMFLFAARRRD